MLHITSGDSAGDSLASSNVSGEILVWHDILYDGLRSPCWPSEEDIETRAGFLEHFTQGGLSHASIKNTLVSQYQRLESIDEQEEIVLWFDACLFDQSMLVHVLTCLAFLKVKKVQLICIAQFPGIVPFNGLGQLSPDQLSPLFHQRVEVTQEQYRFSETAEKAFATQDLTLLQKLSNLKKAPLQWVPSAATRLLQEQPDPKTGLGRLEEMILAAIDDGNFTPPTIYTHVARKYPAPQYWGDITLWAKINGLAERPIPLVEIDGPTEKLPQWESTLDLKHYRIKCL